MISGEGVAVFYSERRRELLMLSLIRGGEKAASHNLYTAFCLKQRIRGLQSEQEKERIWGQEVLVSPPREAQSCQGYSRNIVMWGERGEAKLASLYVHYTYTLKQLTLAKLQGIFGGVV